MRIWADKPESGAVSEYWQKRRASCSLKPACTHYGFNWLVWTQSTVRILTKHRNKIQSLTYLISFYSLWIREGKSWYCTPYGSELVSPGPEYSQDTVLSSETRYVVYLIFVPIMNPIRQARIQGTVRIADINLDSAAVCSWLVPIADPDGYVRTRGTVRIAYIT